MVNYGFLKRLLVVGERHLLEELIQYMDLGTLACDSLKESMGTDKERIALGYRLIKGYEKEADAITMRYRHEITNGAVSTTLMGTLGNLVEKSDSILDASYFIVRELKRMNLATGNFSEEEKGFISSSYRTFIPMLDYEKSALSYVRNMLLTGDIKIMREEMKKIEEMEEAVDEIKDSFIDSLYRQSSKLSYITFSHLLDVVHKMDDLLDYCEDISGLIMTVITAVTK